ncbi:MAG: RNA polymerase sigma factor [Ignavibacteria bacterium]|nr:RNA polymerase sigma factor [Ignavibacteria bacterium]
MISDWEYLGRARNGEEEAWRLLFERHYGALVRMSALIIGSIDTAKDIAQEAFTCLLHDRNEHHGGSFRAYVSTIAFRLALKEKARVRRIGQSGHPESADDSYSPLHSVMQREEQRHLVRVIHMLPDQYRETIVLRFYGELSYEEMAETLGVPVGTVKSRIFYAVKECRKLMKKRGML